ncbi:MAG: dCTP diphosphatase [Flavobacteriales bacterium]|jgi:dCTP diphosphatase
MKDLQKRLVEFGQARNWGKFHNPKNLAMALSVEASELVEIFQWKDFETSELLDDKTRNEAAMELADIFMYTLLMSERLGIDLEKTTLAKIEINEKRFPKTPAKPL